ncbi:MAG: isochorismate synthase [Chloroflexi bacterium]|nr:isochorismate synthase [Chloroflexota bacterium]
MASAAFRAAPLHRRYGRLLSCSLPCNGISFLGFLGAAEGQPRYFWENRSNRLAFAGAGTAVELMAWGGDRFRKIARDARELYAKAHIVGGDPPWTGPRLYGGFSFRGDFTPDNTWSIYAPAHFVLPHYQLVSTDGETWLTINTQIPPEEDPEALVSDLQVALREKIRQLRNDSGRPLVTQQSRLESVKYPMSFDMWGAMICGATERIHAGELNKVVLARAAELRFEERVRMLPILSHLTGNYADCYRFLFEPRPRFAFYGASPELLASVRGKRIETMALAGSIGRGSDGDDDSRLGRELLRSHKNRQEHRIVVDKIRDRLLPLTESLEIAPPGLLKLKNIQHLHSPIHGRLKRATGILALVKALHPTPALGGDPRERAMRLIRDLEPIPRGWYGAPVGWIDANLDGQFTVAIRSAVAQESRVWIYAGAGIVAESQPESEWEETALKFLPMLDAHGDETQRREEQKN